MSPAKHRAGKRLCRKRKGSMQIDPLYQRTTQAHASEMLTVAGTVITNTSSCFITTYRDIWFDIMTVRHRAKTPRNFRDITWMISIGFELLQRALIWSEMTWSGALGKVYDLQNVRKMPCN